MREKDLILGALVGGFCIGIGAQIVGSATMGAAVFLSLLATVLFLFSQNQKQFAAAVLLVAMAGGIIRTTYANPIIDSQLENSNFSGEGTVSEEIDSRENSDHVFITLSTPSEYSGFTVLAYAPPYSKLSYGDHVLVAGSLEKPRSFDTGNGREFDYPGYLSAQGVSFLVKKAHVEAIGGFEGNPIIAGALAIKSAFVQGIERVLPSPESGLGSGITVGEKTSLGAGAMLDFRISSLLHVIVLSGYNIVIVLGALFYFVKNFNKRIRIGAGVLVALFFLAISGGASASVRACVMALVSFAGKWTGRVYDPLRALAVVAFGMLILNPLLLPYDPGFQLSFLATIAIILLPPRLERFFMWCTKRWEIREIMVGTTSAQLMVMPLLLYQNGLLSLVSLCANAAVLPIMIFAMGFTALAGISGMLFGSAGYLLAAPAHALLWYILSAAHFFSSLPFSSLVIPAFPAWLLMPVYGSLAYVIYRLPVNKTTR